MRGWVGGQEREEPETGAGGDVGDGRGRREGDRGVDGEGEGGLPEVELVV